MLHSKAFIINVTSFGSIQYFKLNSDSKAF